MKNKNALLILLAFFAIYFIWGTTYLAVAYALKGFKPFVISALRYLAAGLILLIWLWIKRRALPAKRDMKVLAISGILMLSGGSGLVVVGEQYISSGAAAVIVATEPLFFVLLDRNSWQRYFKNKFIVFGLALGFSGIVLFTYFSPADASVLDHKPVLGAFITLLSAVCWVIGALYANYKVTGKTDNTVASTVQLLAAGIFSAAVAGVKGEWSSLFATTIPATAWLGVAYLVVMGSLVAYLSFNWLIKVQSPAVVSTHTYVNPIVAILMGWLLASESVSPGQLAALVPVLAGVILTQLNKEDEKI